ncbi:hypothetical protein [Saccharopolyspora spinosa]|uniref:Uncharacterized protein n=1 Tax=Saccharopolyspora spinosa TaxID=60894 RepID=A0A2N3XRK5_SACSN|nr:hypothetical protein [Saccharopolyspora spinosa]PKW13293.1 hypothetical protein A8926_0802 [Saccharopolyspora spinosa]
MTPKIFGLAEKTDTGEPDPTRVRIWGMQLPDRAIMYWREDHRNQFAVFEDAASAESRFGTLFDLTLIWP